MNTPRNAVINNQKYSREYIFDNTAVLTTSVENFVVGVVQNIIAEKRINGRISMQFTDFLNRNQKELFPLAVENYKFSIENGYPVRPYESVLNYTCTYNDHYLLSTYRDRYEYTAGAHGNTIRKSDTWNLLNARLLPLSSFFPETTDYVAAVLKEIISQADENMQNNPNIYFYNYKELIVKNFDPENYYLTPDGIAVYFQQYEIAPYSTGIVVFVLPYKITNIRF